MRSEVLANQSSHGVPSITMSGRDIAELTGKDHFHVMRDLRALHGQPGALFGGAIQPWIGAERAPRIAVHYVRRVEEKFICDQLHPASLLLRDAQKWATQQQTGASTPPPSLSPAASHRFAGAGKAILTGSSHEPQLRDCRPGTACPAGRRAAGPCPTGSTRLKRAMR